MIWPILKDVFIFFYFGLVQKLSIESMESEYLNDYQRDYDFITIAEETKNASLNSAMPVLPEAECRSLIYPDS